MSLLFKRRLTTWLLVSSYLAGILGIGAGLLPELLYLTPFNLILSWALLGWNHEGTRREWWLFAVTGFLIGYFIEVAGVATGAIFGHYAYGPVFGVKLWDTPLLIGLNWAMLTYIAGDAAARIFPLPARRILRVSTAAAIPVALDIVMEPVAIRYDMWHWFGKMPPLLNYIGWFAVSLVLAEFYENILGPRRRNFAAPWLLALQAAFFILLNIL